jgi:hypothetical protein
MKPSRKTKRANRRSLASGGSASALFKKLFADVKRRQRERIQKAGKHECVKAACGTMSRVTGRFDKILKRPVTVMRFYECKICGRDMTSNADFRHGSEPLPARNG